MFLKPYPVFLCSRQFSTKTNWMKIKPTWKQHAAVFLFRCMAPLACTYTVYRILVGVLASRSYIKAAQAPLLPLPLEIMIYLEVLFFIYLSWRYSVLRRHRKPPSINREERRKLLHRCLENCEDVKALISGWFMDVPFEKLSKKELLTFLAWMLLGKPLEKVVDAEELEDLEYALCLVQETAEHHLSTEENEKEHPCMRHTLDELKHNHRPIITYLFTHILVNGFLCSLFLRYKGFKYHTAGKISYWHRKAHGEAARAPPIVFCHGIGIGLITCKRLIEALLIFPCDIILVEIPFISLQINESIPSMTETTDGLCKMLDDSQHAKAVFLCHSYGSVWASWMCKQAPDRLAACVFVEPIVFMLFLKTVTRNFLYEHYGGMVAYGIRTELFLNYCLRRHFWWHQNILWYEDMGNTHCRVYLAEGDEVVPTKAVQKYLSKFEGQGNLAVHLLEGSSWHGSWQFLPPCMEQILQGVDLSFKEALKRMKETAPTSPLPDSNTENCPSFALELSTIDLLDPSEEHKEYGGGIAGQGLV